MLVSAYVWCLAFSPFLCLCGYGCAANPTCGSFACPAGYGAYGPNTMCSSLTCNQTDCCRRMLLSVCACVRACVRASVKAQKAQVLGTAYAGNSYGMCWEP